MSFIDSYKHLEKLCGELLGNDRRISAYIDEMNNTPNGARYVKSWDNDLKQLKHYRWMRNKISHDPGYTEENTCTPEDEVWLDEFYTRIINQTDPLALYRKATSKSTQHPTTYTVKPVSFSQQTGSRKTVSWTTVSLILIASLLILTGIIIFTR